MQCLADRLDEKRSSIFISRSSMAIWRFTVGLIPRAWSKLAPNGPEMLYDGEGYYDTSMAWRQNQPSANIIALISQVLPPTESWTDEVRIWGEVTTAILSGRSWLVSTLGTIHYPCVQKLLNSHMRWIVASFFQQLAR